MRTIHAIVYNYPVIEDGEATVVKQIQTQHGYYLTVKEAYAKIDGLNADWALTKSEECSHIVEDYDELYSDLLDKFCQTYGTTPYDFVSININNWIFKKEVDGHCVDHLQSCDNDGFCNSCGEQE